MKQEPGSPQQQAVKQEQQQDMEQFLLPEHAYIDPKCFPEADFELDVSTAWALTLLFHRIQQRPTLPVLFTVFSSDRTPAPCVLLLRRLL